ncbi:MmgE/PrpD family protein [Chitinophaga oryzae]|uniref:MmgE/PrpD family protein n=1 Tax=Chitinophaga oryzae TaxID=2725414 RepID=A0AAE7D6H2_9BACT|nr:MmgE/PrpD family protein [Chitinophaga oryzae]QJB30687.1 MmgE/PrpD family protein [Chitinophaga oryzae]
MTQTEKIAEFALRFHYEDIPPEIRSRLKIHLLDAAASFIWAQFQETPRKMEAGIRQLYTTAQPLAADHAAQCYTAFIRYPDFMDNFLAKESTCHPSDNIGILLAACHLKEISGERFLSAMATAYAVECVLTQNYPVMIAGFDHTTLLAFSATAGAGRLMDLSAKALTHALGIAGCNINPIVTSRASYTTEWKGLASALVNAGCMNLVMMAKNGVSGPPELFEIPEKGYNAVHEQKLEHEWSAEDFQLLSRCILKTYNAEVHTQSVLELIQEMAEAHQLRAAEITEVNITTFLTAYHIVGNGEYGDRTKVYTKEQADHSLPYLAAVVLLDRQVYPPQLTEERIAQEDVQSLLQKVKIHTGFPLHKPVKVAGILDPYTAAYPDKVRCKVEITTIRGEQFIGEKEDYKGFFTRPLTYEDVKEKMVRLNKPYVSEEKINVVCDMIEQLESHTANELLAAMLQREV